MIKNRSSPLKILFRQKIILVLFGLFLFFMLLEVSLRLGGFILLSIQEYSNSQSIKQKGTYCILCLGESTTQGQYPQFLEQILNQRNIGVRFSVIDKGVTGTNTSAILSQVESYLNEYHPDMVVTMMGINDAGEHIPFEVFTTSKGILLIRSFRTYKLTRLLWLHILTKAKEIGFYKSNEDRRNPEKFQTYLPENELKEAYIEFIPIEEAFKKVVELNPKNDSVYVELGRFYQKQDKYSQAEAAFKKAIELNPKNDNIYVDLGWLYQEQGKYSQAEEIFKKVMELNPKNDNAYFGLGKIHQEQGKYSQVEEAAFKKAIELNPKNDNAYVELGQFYQKQSKYSQAEEALKKATELNPKNDNAYVRLAWFYQEQGKYSQAEEAFKKASELNPKNDNAYFELGKLYREQGKYSQAEEIFKKAIELNPKNDHAYGALLLICKEIGKLGLAKEYAQKADRLRLRYYKLVTINNYRKLKQILDKKGIKLVCVQYPMHNIQPLKKILKENENIIFVDNERIFKEAVRDQGYNVYFRDMFGGDFGHCTQKGNRLLANNIANAILKEIFDK